MSGITPNEIKKEFLKSKMGIAGITILIILISISIITTITVPVETFQEWNNPGSWITYQKTAIPIWLNLFLIEKISVIEGMYFLKIMGKTKLYPPM